MRKPSIRFSRLLCAIALAPLILVCGGCEALLAELDAITSPADASTPTDGLREALRVGTGRAVDLLGKADGFLESGVRIPVPDKLERVAQALRGVGADSVVDDFERSMNRAAEAAAPEARAIFVDSIREMTFSDAMTILRGEQHEATDYFRDRAGPRIAELFQPIVERELERVGATRSFNRLIDEIDKLPFVRKPSLDLPDYVTGEALDGLFLTLAREEERIRKDPAARTTELLRRWFSGS